MSLALGPRCARRLCRPARYFSSSAPAPYPPPRQRDGGDDEEGGPSQATFKSFLQKHSHLKTASRAQNYLVRDDFYPFTLNPSFKPPTPISDAVRSRIYADYMIDPQTNSVRALSQRYHISLKRIDAILRLKGLEAAYVKDNKPLQTGFLWGMEMLLGVKQDEMDPYARVDVHTADMLEEEENRDQARQRFQRQFWESIPDDGREPLLPASLEHAKKIAQRSAEAALANRSNERLMPRFKDTDTIKSPREKVQTVKRDGRLALRFVDVGGKFLNSQERVGRIDAAGRRQSLRARRSGEKVLQGYLKGRSTVERKRRAAAKKTIVAKRRAVAKKAAVARKATRKTAAGKRPRTA
ncbi:eukaryotic mitochondrial regulator protein-domain-containing protein [Mycena alexandri]|uniref:Eukaryotic mitochondrial regulator protein-domain-containing protein n=1 Tax=Mycena alexandri TaxID=1745969 RepID=A0AAD6TFC7_9AGAR|nr:eukaryotic mitochondrial regulator protein-domain-containing protein [Mycena alexandri]